MTIADFWWGLLMACLVWYSTITVYVSVRGVWDIRSMLDRLRALRDPQTQDNADDPQP